MLSSCAAFLQEFCESPLMPQGSDDAVCSGQTPPVLELDIKNIPFIPAVFQVSLFFRLSLHMDGGLLIWNTQKVDLGTLRDQGVENSGRCWRSRSSWTDVAARVQQGTHARMTHVETSQQIPVPTTTMTLPFFFVPEAPYDPRSSIRETANHMKRQRKSLSERAKAIHDHRWSDSVANQTPMGGSRVKRRPIARNLALFNAKRKARRGSAACCRLLAQRRVACVFFLVI